MTVKIEYSYKIIAETLTEPIIILPDVPISARTIPLL
jgi:hypothetical protein